jgi:hypothetical protein
MTDAQASNLIKVLKQIAQSLDDINRTLTRIEKK